MSMVCWMDEDRVPHSLKSRHARVRLENRKTLFAEPFRARGLTKGYFTTASVALILHAADARANGEVVVGRRLESQKVKVARANVAQAGLAQFVDIQAGDAMETHADVEETIDFLLLDGWKDIYLPMIKMLAPKIRAGGVVVADNIFTFKTTLAPYVRHMKNTENGFESVTLPIGHGMEYSIRLGG